MHNDDVQLLKFVNNLHDATFHSENNVYIQHFVNKFDCNARPSCIPRRFDAWAEGHIGHLQCLHFHNTKHWIQ